MLKIEYISNGRGVIDLGSVSSNQLSGIIKNRMKNMRRGERIVFKNVKYRLKGTSKTFSLSDEFTYRAI